MSSSAPSVSEISDALATALESIDGLRVVPYLADTVTPPVALIAVEQVHYHEAFQGGTVMHTFTVFVIVARASDRAGLETMEAYMSQPGNTSSLTGAMESDPTLGGVVSAIVVTQAGPPTNITIGGTAAYISLPFKVEVYA